MKIISNTTDFKIPEKTAIAIGKFDGAHIGHKKIFEKLMKAKAQGLKTAVFTFDPSPVAFFTDMNVPELFTKEEKRDYFEKMGIDYLVEYPFNKDTAAVEPRDYIEDYLLNKMNGAYIIAGEDVSYGKKGLGDGKLLIEMSNELDFKVDLIKKVTLDGVEISSTYARDEVKNGNMENATRILGEPYSITGTVMSGKKLGRTLGMPTANMYPSKDKLLPPNGVYFCKIEIVDTKEVYCGVTNIGSRPTVEDGNRISVETFLLGFDGDLYEKKICVSLVHFKRPEMRFSSVEELQKMVLRNIQDAREFFEIT